MTRITPWRFTILQLSQMRFTDALTFTGSILSNGNSATAYESSSGVGNLLLVPVDNAPTR